MHAHNFVLVCHVLGKQYSSSSSRSPSKCEGRVYVELRTTVETYRYLGVNVVSLYIILWMFVVNCHCLLVGYLLLLGFSSIVSVSMGFSPLQAKNQHSTPIGELVAPPPPQDLQPVFSQEDNSIIKTPAVLNYVAPQVTKARIARDSKGCDSDATESSVIWQEAVAWIHNGRNRNLTLHANGFELLENASLDSESMDFLDKNAVIDTYYPHCENLLREYLQAVDDGAKVKVYAFDHNVRLQNKGAINPLGIVHRDYTKTSAPRRIQLLSEAPKTNDVLRERLGDTPLIHPDVVQKCLAANNN